jgi:hypothetical protein
MTEPLYVNAQIAGQFKEQSSPAAISLNSLQKRDIAEITRSIVEVDEGLRNAAIPDIYDTLENGNPLNRLIQDSDGTVTGYIACTDEDPGEAYIKYVGTNRKTGINLLQEIPAFLKFAQEQGYTKISFDGWNPRFNRVLERFGFNKVKPSGFGADQDVFYYEKNLIPSAQKEYESLITSLPEDEKNRVISAVNISLEALTGKLEGSEAFMFGPLQRDNLRLKLARWYQRQDEADINSIYQAIVETPKFLDTTRGSVNKLLQVYEAKMIQRIAESRKKIARRTDSEGGNPFENLFTTSSGNYYMARLLNLPHLEKESEFMDHCVGKDNSYSSKIIKGEIEILSFRKVPTINEETQQLEDDNPIITIEYNLKTKTIEEIKKSDDDLLTPDDPFYEDFLETLALLRTTKTDRGNYRDFVKINPEELESIEIEDGHILTQRGEIPIEEFDPEQGDFVILSGDLDIDPETPKDKVAKFILTVDGLRFSPDEIALKTEEITPNTKVFIGELTPGFFSNLSEKLKYIYTTYPDGKLEMWPNIKTIALENASIFLSELERRNITVDNDVPDILNNLQGQSINTNDKVRLVAVSLEDMGLYSWDEKYMESIYSKAIELGLELCPPEAVPALRLKFRQPNEGLVYIGMKPVGIADEILALERDGPDRLLVSAFADKTERWDLTDKFVFRIP